MLCAYIAMFGPGCGDTAFRLVKPGDQGMQMAGIGEFQSVECLFQMLG